MGVGESRPPVSQSKANLKSPARLQETGHDEAPTKGLLRQCGLTFFDFLKRDVFDVRGNPPEVTRGVSGAGVAVSVELVCRFHDRFTAGIHCAIVNGVRIRDVEIKHTEDRLMASFVSFKSTAGSPRARQPTAPAKARMYTPTD